MKYGANFSLFAASFFPITQKKKRQQLVVGPTAKRLVDCFGLPWPFKDVCTSCFLLSVQLKERLRVLVQVICPFTL